MFEGITYIYLESDESHAIILVVTASNQMQLQTNCVTHVSQLTGRFQDKSFFSYY